jgi:hypothetical protein
MTDFIFRTPSTTTRHEMFDRVNFRSGQLFASQKSDLSGICIIFLDSELNGSKF